MNTSADAIDETNGVKQAIALALLEGDKEKHARLSSEVEKILAFVREVQSIKIDEDRQGSGSVNVFRDDVVTVEAGMYQERMLAQAPMSFKRWFLSKKIL